MPNTRPPIDYIQRTREQYSSLGYPTYRWVESDTPPRWAPVRKPLSQSRVGLVASGGLYLAGQVAFHFKDDFSYREIDTTAPASELRVSHFAYDVSDARSDPNVVFPAGTLRGLVAEGKLGELAKRAYTFMGGIYSSRKVRDILAPAIAERLVQDEVDLVLLVPV
jgi:D-proline reductase (dithiol) PrdB